MAKILIVVLLVAFAVGNSFQGKKKTDVEHEGLKGRVKSVQVRLAKVLGQSGAAQESRSEFLGSFKYDSKGMLSEKVFVENRTKVTHFYRYDSNGNRTASEISQLGSKLLSWVFKYDSMGNRIEEKEFADGVQVSTSFYKYDTSDNRIEETTKRQKFSLHRRVGRYDDKGNLQEVAVYIDSTMIREESYEYEFDLAGNWIKRIASTLPGKSGKALSEPVSVTYRTINYY